MKGDSLIIERQSSVTRDQHVNMFKSHTVKPINFAICYNKNNGYAIRELPIGKRTWHVTNDRLS